MNDEQLVRYSRQIMLPEIDIEGQQKLLDARCLIIGMGGLGSPASMYLAAAGVGTLVLSDFDRVDLSNLQRQIMHSTFDIDKPKVESARETLEALNPSVRIEVRDKQLDSGELANEVGVADVVLDCSDNFATRFAVNRACVATKTPLVSGATIRFEGQISVFDLRDAANPCYNCLYAELDELSESCARTGVVAALTGVVGSIQALEAIKILSNVGKPLAGRLLLLDALTMEWNTLRLAKNPSCPTCSQAP
ncbi:MAG: molybdopterin-synthase adenylyltransferase MoeB [Methylococcaceae bacterium]|nr:molybdopterin-synthase adenylyltransferase MoeB [Methylococcaceae bacterium]MCI0667605.1 molybdopterin-synthase adenylyltransferase MoeB [Methylococcaceae bacterium]MCI0734589.1 molybdopterin-synthase adenylyltransferase MoeB [Methylococcaceae bacterium]